MTENLRTKKSFDEKIVDVPSVFMKLEGFTEYFLKFYIPDPAALCCY